MSKRHAALIVTTIVLGAGSIAHATEDPVAASFERMFSHEPSYATPAATVAQERDPLLHAVASALGAQWSPYPAPAARASAPARDDQALASFNRMLGHEPAIVAPAFPEGLGEDPLYAAVVMPLRDQGIHPVGPLHALIPQDDPRR